jgi:hypothetical protein
MKKIIKHYPMTGRLIVTLGYTNYDIYQISKSLVQLLKKCPVGVSEKNTEKSTF